MTKYIQLIPCSSFLRKSIGLILKRKPVTLTRTTQTVSNILVKNYAQSISNIDQLSRPIVKQQKSVDLSNGVKKNLLLITGREMTFFYQVI